VQKVGDAPVAVAAEPASESNDRRGQGVLVVSKAGSVSLAGTVLTEGLAGPALGDMQPLTDRVDASAPTRGA
jgi:hypothetical protein